MRSFVFEPFNQNNKMITPDTDIGRLTERIMLRVRDRMPELDTPSHDRMWESLHEVLSEELQRNDPNQFTLNLAGDQQ